MNNRYTASFLIILLTACAHMTRESTDLTRNNDIKPILACGVQCLTIKQGSAYQSGLKQFLHEQNPNKTVIVSNCRNRPVSPVFLNKVAKSIVAKGLRVALAKPVLPYKPDAAACMVLVRGPIIMYPPKCLKPKRKRGAFVFPITTPLVGDDFGCYSQQNLAYMIDNPADLLILSGYSGDLQ